MTVSLVLLGWPEDLVEDEDALPAVSRYDNPVMEAARALIDPDDPTLHGLVLTHRSGWRDWTQEVPHDWMQLYGVNSFSNTAAEAALMAQLDPLWWPGGIDRIFVSVHPAYAEIVSRTLFMLRMHESATWAEGTPRRQARALKEWAQNHEAAPRLKRWMVPVRNNQGLEKIVYPVLSAHPTDAQHTALQRAFHEKGWRSVTAGHATSADDARREVVERLDGALQAS